MIVPQIVFKLNIQLAYKTLNHKTPKAIEMLSIRSSNPYSTRNVSLKLLFQPSVRTKNFGFNSVRNQTIINWNCLQVKNKHVDLASCNFLFLLKLISAGFLKKKSKQNKTKKIGGHSHHCNSFMLLEWSP